MEAKVVDVPPMLARWCAVAHAGVLVMAGDPDAAVNRFDERPEPSGYPAALEQIVLAKAHLLLGRPSTALDLLDPLPKTAMPYRVTRVEANVLAAVAADQTHRASTALTAISTAIDLAHDAGITRPFLTAGPQITGLLARYQHIVAQHPEFIRTLLAAASGDPLTDDAGLPLLEPLSERELVVLSYLPTMLKSAEIATDLFISINTVKTHQQGIYRKLGVNTRREAVERARALKFL
jgi:LuxR family maltose regulon positive regulatory protein